MSLLSDSEASGEETKVERLKVNAKFADRFEKSERVKDLHRAKELLKNGNGVAEDSDSESETEDEDAELLSTGLDLKIIQTINSLRKRDPKIYDQTTKWFDPRNSSDSDSDDEEAAPKAGKKKKFKDILREQLLESEAAGGLGDGDGIETATRGVRDTASRNTLVYDAEQEKIRQAFIKSAGGGKDDSSKSKRRSQDSSDEEDDILQVKSKTPQDLKAEEAELKKALKEMRELSSKNSKEEKSKPVASNKTAVLEGEQDADGFLESYLEKQMWKEKDNKSRRSKKQDSDSEEDLEDDEAELEQMDRFESKYNFRFEELADQQARNGGAEVSGLVEVTGHARDVQGSMRRIDDKRKTQRESRKERKEKERRQQEAELRRLKNLKRQELSDRLKQIGQMSGLRGEGGEEEDIGQSMKLNEDFLDEDWDPEKHEALMAAQFGDDYYGEEDTDFKVADMTDMAAYEDYLNGDEVIADDGYDYDEQDGGQGDGQEAGEDAVVVPKGLKGKARAEYVKNAASMADELYQLDYEDIVAGLPCRFKYKQVEKESFGLTAEDILLADDSELNKYVSLKKISAYSMHSGVADGDLSKKRKRLRENVKERLAREAEEAEAKGLQVKGTKPKAKTAAAEVAEKEEEVEAEGGEDGDKKRKRKRRKGADNNSASADVADVASGKPAKDTRPISSASKPKGAAAAAVAAVVVAEAAASADKPKDRKKKRKQATRKKEESEMDKRLGLYH